MSISLILCQIKVVNHANGIDITLNGNKLFLGTALFSELENSVAEKSFSNIHRPFWNTSIIYYITLHHDIAVRKYRGDTASLSLCGSGPTLFADH